MERRLETLFPSAVQITDVERAHRLNRRLLRTIESIRAETPNGRPDSWGSTVFTTLNSADQLHRLADFADLHEIILHEAGRFADALGINHAEFPLRITDCWFNIYGPKDGQEVHQHANNILSGSYYVKAPPGCAGLMFHSTRADLMLVPPLSAVNALNETIAEMPVHAGMLVLFQSSLKHSVRPSPTAEERISISFNISM
jgi:uncharacterized protein (TIGR02466 family)